MEIKDLEAFQNLPFLRWVKDEEWRYLRGKRAICDLAGENVVGKTDGELNGRRLVFGSSFVIPG